MSRKVEIGYQVYGRPASKLKPLARAVRLLEGKDPNNINPRQTLKRWGDLKKVDIHPRPEPVTVASMEVNGETKLTAHRPIDLVFLPNEKDPGVQVVIDPSKLKKMTADYGEGEGNLMVYELQHQRESLLVGMFPWMSDDYGIGLPQPDVAENRRELAKLEGIHSGEHPWIIYYTDQIFLVHLSGISVLKGYLNEIIKS